MAGGKAEGTEGAEGVKALSTKIHATSKSKRGSLGPPAEESMRVVEKVENAVWRVCRWWRRPWRVQAMGPMPTPEIAVALLRTTRLQPAPSALTGPQASSDSKQDLRAERTREWRGVAGRAMVV